MGKHPYKYWKTPPRDLWDPRMGALGPPHGNPGTSPWEPWDPPMGSLGGPLGTHGAMDPGLWGPMGQGTHWPRTQASGTWGFGDLGPLGTQGPGAMGTPGPRSKEFLYVFCCFYIL